MAFSAALRSFEEDDSMTAILVKSSSPKAFCAGIMPVSCMQSRTPAFLLL